MTLSDRVEGALARIALRDSALGAWAHVDTAGARQQARRADDAAPLRGLLLGVKDIIDVGGLPCGVGSPIFRERHAFADAAIVARLKALGAIVLGKTVTTAFAFLDPAATRNPHDLSRSPGGSSSGSAAAVADRHVDAALATQTAGSIARPAAFCGIVGYKPTHGLFGLAGVAASAPTLDTVGWMSRDIATTCRIHAALTGEPPSRPASRLGSCRTVHWERADEAMRDAFLLCAAALGAAEVASPPAALDVLHATIMRFEMTRDLATEWLQHRELLPQSLREFLSGAAPTDDAYRAARSARNGFDFDGLFGASQVLVLPSAAGEAVAFGSTGDPAFNRFVTLLGCPSVTLPFARGLGGLPLGLQLIARPHEDAMLLATAAIVEQAIRDDGSWPSGITQAALG
ncbi:amidase [Lichenicola cladoniae]|uniref:Amidase n=1 Tax=Lichenicola cladoniae TaxID=1484109 RepID=A0A6M8HMP4_9PROT|nr:amidase [Lichenicola cladoniae]NPD67056.1 amidase [Acetobacteraceae bacterium]QKE89597.1 amidase [Lichenicola cladoniae]